MRSVEDIVSRDVNESGIHRCSGSCGISRALCVDAHRESGFTLGFVDGSVSRRIYDRVRSLIANDCIDSPCITDVELIPRQSDALEPSGSCSLRNLPAGHAAGAQDQQASHSKLGRSARDSLSPSQRVSLLEMIGSTAGHSIPIEASSHATP